MRLKDLLIYDKIVIQCHDNPDADAIASGYGLYLYFMRNKKEVRLVYSGSNIVRKCNLVTMIKELDIPIEHIRNTQEEEDAKLLITVDCQYGEGNVSMFPAERIAVIDHHCVERELPELHRVDSTLGSCSTLVYQMLKEEGIDINENEKLATALYYGLYTDTGSFDTIYQKDDLQLREKAAFSQGIISRLKNANISIEELEVAGAALLRCDYNEQYRFAVVKAGPCDPNVLGLISDMVLKVDAIDTCVVFNYQPEGVKLSIRSCNEKVKANELAARLCVGLGSGGGHDEKAGGFLQMKLLASAYETYCRSINAEPRMEPDEVGRRYRPTMSAVKSLLEYRMVDYFDKQDDAEAVIFDLDGTLLDTLEDLTDAVNMALRKYHLPQRKIEEVKEFVGNGLRSLMIKAVEGGEAYPMFEELFAFFREYYKEHCNHKTHPYEGIMELIKELKERGIRMAIVSNKIDAGVKELNEKFFSEYITLAIGEREGIRRKPAPDSLNEALRILGVEKEHALYVGDSEVDIQTANNANLRCVSVEWGFRDKNFLIGHGARNVITRPLELLEYL